MIKKILTILFFFYTLHSFADTLIKIGYTGYPMHDQLIRLLTQGTNVAVINKQGGKGIIAYTALENHEIDFLLVPNSIAVLSPIIDNELYNFTPTERFRFISYLAFSEPAFLVAPKYASFTDLTDSKKKTTQPVFAAAAGDESDLITKFYFRSKGLITESILYNGGGNTPIIDTLASRTDVMMVNESIAQKYVDRGASYIRFKDLDIPILKKAEFGVLLVARKDMPQSVVDDFMNLLRSNYDKTEDLRKSNNVYVTLMTEKQTQYKIAEYRNLITAILKKD